MSRRTIRTVPGGEVVPRFAGMTAPRAKPVTAGTEDGVIFVVLVLTLMFLMFMASVPVWFPGLVLTPTV